LASNPPTPIESVLPFVNDCDLTLTMSVMPGFGGQAFNPVAIDKIRRIREIASENKFISIDGGIGESTIADVAGAGANLFVVGSALLGHPDISAQFQRLRQLAARP